MKKLVKLIEKAKLEKVDMEILIERFLPLIRRLAHKLPYEYQDAEQDLALLRYFLPSTMETEFQTMWLCRCPVFRWVAITAWNRPSSKFSASSNPI